ncbi:MAG: ABC transporter ATP-binding protein [Anaerolineae bacterium]|nr:ABC transporter ATP-binding protein [Anaerolineae bacterium]
MSIVLEHVTKLYGEEPVVRDLSLAVEPGELFVLLGASGSGKSTLLRMIAGLTPTDGGTIRLDGRDVTHLPPQQRGVGFVFQNYSLFQHLTAAQNIAFGLDVQRMPRAQKQQRVAELLELIGLAEYGDRKPAQLSGGQQQRIAVARALAQNPHVLLLDEPFGALDVKIRGQLRHNLRAIQQRLKVTTILVTHDQDEAFELADRIGVIDDGRLLEVGKPAQLYRKPEQRFTATFLGNVNLLRGTCNGAYLHFDDMKLPIKDGQEHFSGQPVDVMTRPESIFLTSTREGQHGHVLGKGTVIAMDFAGPMERIVIRLEHGTELQVLTNMNRTHELGLHLGTEVWAGMRDYHLLPVEG